VLPWILFAVFVGAGLTGSYLQELNATPGEERDYYLLAAFIIFAAFGSFVASKVPRNPIGWLFMAVASLAAVGFLGGEYAEYALRTAPGSLPLPYLAAWLAGWTWIPTVGLLGTFLFLLFPDGRLPSRRWKPVAWFDGAVLVAAFVGLAFSQGRLDVGVPVENPVGVIPLGTGGTTLAETFVLPLFLPAVVLSVSSVFFRYRRAGEEQRHQLKWFLFAAVLTAASFIGGDFLPDPLGNLLFALVLLALPAATAVAVLKYRLYDIDVVLNKTVVYLVLAGFITVVYAVVVLVIPVVVFGTGEGGIDLLPFLAVALVAVAVQPVRRWASRLANRLVYGKRATPYEVLSEFSKRVAGTYAAEEVLHRMAQTLGQGTGASRAEVWLHVGDSLRRVSVWPDDTESAGDVLALPPEGLPALPGTDVAVPVEDRGELLGALAITVARGEVLTPSQRRLVGDLASQAGLVLRNVRLLEELRASRQRIVAAQDHERRRLERNIHDGAQQQLVALSVKLRLAETLVDRDPENAKGILAEVKAESTDALENLRDLARGIYPPLLADKGLAAALEAQARKLTVPVELATDAVGRLPQEVEAGVYFCVLEALQNVTKYAEASTVTIRLATQDRQLVFEVADDGRGFDRTITPRGSGLENMRDRVEALGGSLSIESEPGRGTTVAGEIPVQR
jgi:signal transduction histidine kinase